MTTHAEPQQPSLFEPARPLTWHSGGRTSRLAAEAAIGRAPTQQATVYAYVWAHPDSSRQDIADATGIRLSAVCGRVKSLLNAKTLWVSGIKPGEYGTAVETLQVARHSRAFGLGG